MPRIINILLDRDGTVITDKHYLADPAGVELLPGVAESLGALARRGLHFFLVSNQSGIGRGLFSREAADAVNGRMAALLAPYGVFFTDMLYCPHAPEERCLCRKPGTGMWDTLAATHGLAPEETLMAGDKAEDILFAANAEIALRTLVFTGKGQETAQSLFIPLPDMYGVQTGNSSVGLVESPASKAHPHLTLSSLAVLDEALNLLSLRKGWVCGA